MGVSVLLIAVLTATPGSMMSKKEVEQQEKVFQSHWGTDFVWKFDELPVKGSVPKLQIPYSGYIYPDTAGGTVNALRKYDAAFNGGRSVAAAHEKWDTTAFKEPTRKRGLFGGPALFTTMRTPNWYGHCNGWAAATIRHAEPQTSVRMNGVTFSPADIKALLAELYIYNDTLDLSGDGELIDAGLFHAVVANWMGRGSHGLGMEADPGEEKWNYPMYAFNSDFAKRPGNRVEVKMNAAYLKDSNGEYQESPKIKMVKYFHYTLQLNANGEIIGGAFHGDSSRIDMLWIPLAPKAARQPGNERGNPYIRPSQVLAIWRASVPSELRKQWVVVDPAPEDRRIEVADTRELVPATIERLPLTTPPEAVTAADEENDEADDSLTLAAPNEADSETESAEMPDQPDVSDASENVAGRSRRLFRRRQ